MTTSGIDDPRGPIHPAFVPTSGRASDCAVA
jgi:hypothetical protein